MAKLKFTLNGKKFATREAYNQALNEGPAVKRLRKAPATPKARKAKTPTPKPSTACSILSRGLRMGCGKNANTPISDAKVRAVRMFAGQIAELSTEDMPSVFAAMDKKQPAAAPIGVVEDAAMRAPPPSTGAQVAAPGESRVTALATAASVDPPVQPNPAPVRKRAVLTQVSALVSAPVSAAVSAPVAQPSFAPVAGRQLTSGQQLLKNTISRLEVREKSRDPQKRLQDIRGSLSLAERLRRMR